MQHRDVGHTDPAPDSLWQLVDMQLLRRTVPWPTAAEAADDGMTQNQQRTGPVCLPTVARSYQSSTPHVCTCSAAPKRQHAKRHF